MPRTPQLRTGVQPTTGSVGRLRVDAPQGAFGGGAGLARVGQGMQGLGKGIQDVGDRQDQEQKDAATKQRKLNRSETILKYQHGLKGIGTDQNRTLGAGEVRALRALVNLSND